MKRYVIFILLTALPFLSRADGGNSDKKKDKGQTQCEKKKGRANLQIHSIEEFGFMVPPPSPEKACRSHNKRYHRAIVNFYQWYLNNQTVIVEGLSDPDNQKDLLPPFHVSYESLHRFYVLIRQKYPDWVSELVPETKPQKEPDTGLKTDIRTTQCNPASVTDTLSTI